MCTIVSGIPAQRSYPGLMGRKMVVIVSRVMGRTLVSAGELSLSYTRLLAGRLITLWARRPLSVSQHGQLSHTSLRGR